MSIGARIRSIEWCSFNNREESLTHVSRARRYSTLNISETAQDRDIVIME